MLAGHSYGGGLVITEASAGSGNVKHLVKISTVRFVVNEVWEEITIPAADWIKPSAMARRSRSLARARQPGCSSIAASLPPPPGRPASCTPT